MKTKDERRETKINDFFHLDINEFVMFSRIVLLVSVFLLLVSCQEQQKESGVEKEPGLVDVPSVEYSHFDFEEVVDQTKDVFLSDFVESIDYVALETTAEYLIGEKGLSIKPCGEYIFVDQDHMPIGVFDRAGRFVRTIGQVGKGPGEFNFDYLFHPDRHNQTVCIWNANRSSIMVFDWLGDLVREISPEYRMGAFAPLGHGMYLNWSFGQSETADGQFFRVFFHDSTGANIRQVFEPKIELTGRRMFSIIMPHLSPTIGGFLFNSWEQDTIFFADHTGTFEPALTWNLGKYKMPFDPINDYDRYKREKHRYIKDIHACESRENWYLKYYYPIDLKMGVFNKLSGDFYSVANPDTLQKGVFNDIDGGPSFWPFWDNEGGHTFVRVIPSIDFLQYEASQSNHQGPYTNNTARQKYLSMLSRLKEDSNPVVMLVNLR